MCSKLLLLWIIFIVQALQARARLRSALHVLDSDATKWTKCLPETDTSLIKSLQFNSESILILGSRSTDTFVKLVSISNGTILNDCTISNLWPSDGAFLATNIIILGSNGGIQLHDLNPITCAHRTVVNYAQQEYGINTYGLAVNLQYAVVLASTTNLFYFDGITIPHGITKGSTVGVVSLVDLSTGERRWNEFIYWNGTEQIMIATPNVCAIQDSRIVVSGTTKAGEWWKPSVFIANYNVSGRVWSKMIDIFNPISNYDVVKLVMDTTATTQGYIIVKMTDDNRPPIVYSAIVKFNTLDPTGDECDVVYKLLGSSEGQSNIPVDAAVHDDKLYIFINAERYRPFQQNPLTILGDPRVQFSPYYRDRGDWGIIELSNSIPTAMNFYGGAGIDVAIVMLITDQSIKFMAGYTTSAWVSDPSCSQNQNKIQIIMTTDNCVPFRPNEYCLGDAYNCSFRECSYVAPCPAMQTCPGNGLAYPYCSTNVTQTCEPSFVDYMSNPHGVMTCTCSSNNNTNNDYVNIIMLVVVCGCILIVASLVYWSVREYNRRTNNFYNRVDL